MAKRSATILIIKLVFGLKLLSQVKPIKKPSWHGYTPPWPPAKMGAPVPEEEVPIDDYQFILFLVGILLVYVYSLKKQGLTYREIYSFKTLRSFLF